MKQKVAVIFSLIFIFTLSQNKNISSGLSYIEMENLIQSYYSKNENGKVKETSKIYLDWMY